MWFCDSSTRLEAVLQKLIIATRFVALNHVAANTADKTLIFKLDTPNTQRAMLNARFLACQLIQNQSRRRLSYLTMMVM